ncbi:MAG TPA: protein kinase [Polyangiales bacterium]|nr:protein kinase [Polyangiales bacterium]
MHSERSSGGLLTRPEPPTSIAGRYTVIDQLGAGGMGAVYRVRDEATGALVALKQLLSASSGNTRRKLEALFEREYHTLARLEHPRIIEVYEYGLTDDGPFYTMELLDGGDLQQRSPLPWREVCQHLCDVASSLALLHAHRLVHRDITPRNIRLTSAGRAKLIDFGALGVFGPAVDVVGTPVCMAPEVLHRGTLDQRSDLFALGVVGYYALTGCHPYPARGLGDLPGFWAQTPLPPSQLSPQIPSELNALIMSMISPDPLSRPAHAAQVIDQLCAVAGLEVSDAELAADSYLASGRLVGRENEQQELASRCERALSGRGAALLLSGAAGSGKTRLLRETGLNAQLRGMLVLEADAQLTTGYFGLAVALAVDLLERGGDVARNAAQPYASLLAQLSPALHERLGDVALEQLPPNRAEQRARFQAALSGWFESVAQARSVLVLIDNLQASDESSAAFLTTLGLEMRKTQLFVLCAVREGDEVRAPQPVALLRMRSGQLELPPLDAAACHELVRSLFGDVAHCGRIAKLLHEKSAGNPQHCMELAQLLVRKQIVKYEGGTWLVPAFVASDELPDRLEDLFAAKLAALSPDAFALAESLCIHAKPVPIEQCLALADGLNEARAHAALDTLVSEQIVLCRDARYDFAQKRLRDSLLASLVDERARALHRHAARVLEASDDLRERMQRGWHLLRAGEERAGAELLASTSRAYLQMPSAREDSQDVIAGLRAALEIYERHGRSAHERAGLLFPLVLLVYYYPDNQLIQHYAPRALRLGLEITGLGFAQRVQARLGKERALALGMRWAERGFARERARSGLQLTLAQAIGTFSSLVPASLGAFAVCYDTQGAELVGELAEPLGLFPEGKLPALMYTWRQGQLFLVRGLEGDARQQLSHALTQLQQPAMREALGDAHWRTMRGGLMMLLGLLSCYHGSPETLAIADEMASTGVRVWALAADQIRLLHHVYRGESDRVLHYREQVERSALQGVPTWHTELFLPAAMLWGEVASGDTIAVRRIYQQLQRTAQRVPALRVHADCARAAYLSLRGDHDDALELYERILVELPVRRSIHWLPARGHYARALNRAGEHARAKQLLLETLEHVTDLDRGVRVLCFEARRQLVLAQAALGELEQASQALEALLREYEPDQNPMLLGLLHETRAQCALAAAERDAYVTHAEAAQVYFRRTHNPALIAHIQVLEQLALAVRSDGQPAFLALSGTARSNESGTRLRHVHTLAELSVAPDRARYALDLLIQETRAKGGCLYLLEGDDLQLTAASATHEPPQELERELLARIQQFRAELESLADESETRYSDSLRVPSVPVPRPKAALFVESIPPTAERAYRLAVLAARRAGQQTAIGGVILTFDPAANHQIDSRLLSAIAQAVDTEVRDV